LGFPSQGVWKPSVYVFLASVGLKTPSLGVFLLSLGLKTLSLGVFLISLGLWTPLVGVWKGLMVAKAGTVVFGNGILDVMVIEDLWNDIVYVPMAGI
jgi:hypothetical protein